MSLSFVSSLEDEVLMRPNQIEDDDEEEFRGPSKSHLKRVQNELQELGRVMTGMGDENAQRRLDSRKLSTTKSSNTAVCVISALSADQLQLIGKKMRDMDPAAVREAIARATGESRAAVALQHRCEALRDRFLADDEAVKTLLTNIPTSIFGGCVNWCAAPAVNASKLSPQRVLANFIVCSMPISMNRST